MNYYQYSNNGYLMNNQYDDCYNNENYYDHYLKNNSRCNYYNDYKNSNCQNSKPHCCVKRVEETYLCFPSYLNEEKNYGSKQFKEENCLEGTFKICPKHYENEKENCNCKNHNLNNENNHSCNNRFERCGLCRLFKHC